MPFAAIAANRRLGTANSPEPDATSFNASVLQLASNSPAYQQQVVHKNNYGEGPPMEAAICPAVDNDYNRLVMIREVSPADHFFGRRNITLYNEWDFANHKNRFGSQIYYIINEPEFGSYAFAVGRTECENCWDPSRDLAIDPYIQGGAVTNFWEPGVSPRMSLCTDTAMGQRRITATSLAYTYLKILRDAEDTPWPWGGNRGHVVLPPAFLDPRLGLYWQTDAVANYVKVFFDTVRDGIYDQSGAINRIHALHSHYYDLSLVYNTDAIAPLTPVAGGADRIVQGADWFRTRYFPSQSRLPLDILISETGPDWQIKYSPDPSLPQWMRDRYWQLLPRAWAGGWPSFRSGLSWWNSWLCWLTRVAGVECSLQGWETYPPAANARMMHACIHDPSSIPYVTEATSGYGWSVGSYVRNNRYLNVDDLTDTWAPEKNVISVPGLAIDGRYQNSFSAWQTIQWNPIYNGQYVTKSWLRGPFGACYAVWAEVGADLVTSGLASGWVLSTQPGWVGPGSVTLPIPQNYSTSLIPIIKGAGASTWNDYIQVEWTNRFSNTRVYGYVYLPEFPDSQTPSGSARFISSAAVVPIVCNAGSYQNVTIRVRREGNSLPIYVGRPIVLRGACSWLSDQ